MRSIWHDITLRGAGLIGATYFGADIITKGITGKSLGSHLDEYIEENYDKDNGILLKF